MNQLLGSTSLRFVGPATIRTVDASTDIERPAVLDNLQRNRISQFPPILPHPIPIPEQPESLPLVNSNVGNLFIDRNDENLHWYLPQFSLADNVDPKFAFVASQSGQDTNGNPFYTAQLTLRMHKSKPADALNLSQTNPAAIVQEIPLAEMSAILTSFYNDDLGQAQLRTFRATIKDEGNGDFLFTFSPILGSAVIGLYQDLTVFGKAVINLSASYQAWSQAGFVPLPLRFRVGVLPMPMRMLDAQPTSAVAPANLGLSSPRIRSFMAPETNVQNRSWSATLEQTRQTWTTELPLDLKFKQDGYQLKYTVSTATIANHIIRDAKDLKDFSLSQSEFAELKVLGDVSQRYPTMSRLYIGVLSRTIVVIPRRYSIVRSSIGCAASCMALVDSSAAAGSKCKFEFDFTIAPEVSRIEFFKLTQELQNRDDLKGYILKLPDFLRANPPSTLQTIFKSRVDISPGTDPKTFAVTVSVEDDGTQTPAVANANLFITQVCSSDSFALIGSLSLKLDDGYQDPVFSTIVLNFDHTVGTDELVTQIEEGSADIRLINRSNFDLQLSRYALIKGSQLTEVPNAPLLPRNSSITVPLPVDHAELQLASDSQLVVPSPMNKSDIQEFFSFHTADVQETQYVIAVSGSGINFNKVDSLNINVTFSALPSVVPRVLKLNKNLHADSTHIIIPLENAVFSLPGTVNVTVHFVDAGINDLNFTVDHDFTAEPVLVILQNDIEKNLPKA